MTGESLILRVHEDTYMFPRYYGELTRRDVQNYGALHRQVKDAIINDGMGPAQLRVLRENRKLFVKAARHYQTEAQETKRQLDERRQWCWWLSPDI